MIRHNWLVYYLHDKALKACLKAHAHGKLIDIGCGTKPYKGLYTPYVSYSFGVDHLEGSHGLTKVDIAATAYAVPVKDRSFDTILLTAVLEHLEEPAKALVEICRILKPGGTLILSVPLFWHLHEEPRDFYRYTKHGLRYLLKKADLQILELKPLSGFWVTFGIELAYYLRKTTSHFGRPLIWLGIILGHCMQILSLIIDSIHKDEPFTWAYLVVAGKAQKSSDRANAEHVQRGTKLRSSMEEGSLLGQKGAVDWRYFQP